MDSRNSILKRIQEAGCYSADTSEHSSTIDLKISESIKSITPESNKDLWDQFKKEIELVAGAFYKTESINASAEIIIKFLTESKISRVGISNEEICLKTALKIKEIESGLKIISPSQFDHAERKKEYAVTEAAVVNPSFAIADTGTLVFTLKGAGTSYPHFLCDNIFALIDESRIVPNQFELFRRLRREEMKEMFFVTGPSRTADIEKILVLGAHGPRNLTVLMSENIAQ